MDPRVLSCMARARMRWLRVPEDARQLCWRLREVVEELRSARSRPVAQRRPGLRSRLLFDANKLINKRHPDATHPISKQTDQLACRSYRTVSTCL